MRGGYQPIRQEDELRQARRRLEQQLRRTHPDASSGGAITDDTFASTAQLPSHFPAAMSSASSELPGRQHQPPSSLASARPFQSIQLLPKYRLVMQRAQLEAQLQARARIQAEARVQALLVQEALLRQRQQHGNIFASLQGVSELDSSHSLANTIGESPSTISRPLLALSSKEWQLPPVAGAAQHSHDRSTSDGTSGDAGWNLANTLHGDDGPWAGKISLSHSTLASGMLQVDLLERNLSGSRRENNKYVESGKEEEECIDEKAGENNGGDVEDDDNDAIGDEGYFVAHPRKDLNTKQKRETFPLKLYRILYEAEENGHADIISFLPHGESFRVHKPKEFMSLVMPKYFAVGRMNTFHKQLNLYNFKRITTGPEKGAYYHKKFAKGKRHQCNRIKRKKITVAATKSVQNSASVATCSSDLAKL